MSGETHRFSADIYRVNENPCLDVPTAVSTALSHRRYIPVVGTLNDQPLKATLVPDGVGGHRLLVNNPMRFRAQVGVGDAVELELRLDKNPLDIPVPPDLHDSLRLWHLLEAWEELSPALRKQIILHVRNARTPRQRGSRVSNAVWAAERGLRGARPNSRAESVKVVLGSTLSSLGCVAIALVLWALVVVALVLVLGLSSVVLGTQRYARDELTEFLAGALRMGGIAAMIMAPIFALMATIGATSESKDVRRRLFIHREIHQGAGYPPRGRFIRSQMHESLHG